MNIYKILLLLLAVVLGLAIFAPILAVGIGGLLYWATGTWQ